MTALDALILGIVEGITEYLPVSSTGHLILVSRWLGLAGSDEARQSIDTFNIVVQGAAVLAVAGLYRHEVARIIRAILAFSRAMSPAQTHRRDLKLSRNLLISFLPAAVIGVTLGDWFEERFFAPGPVVAALALGGVVMIALAPWVRGRAQSASDTSRDGSTLSASAALGIGFIQCLALFPGTSRSMVTILGSLLCGLSPREAAKYSFLLALPTLGAACAYKSLGLFKSGTLLVQLGGWLPLTIGLVAAFVSAALSIRWLIGYLGRGGFALFGWWRIAVAAIVMLGLYQGWIPQNLNAGESKTATEQTTGVKTP